MDGTSPGGMAIGFGAGMQWFNPETNEWQPTMPSPQVTCAANPPRLCAGFVNIGGGVGDMGGYLPCGCYGGPWWGINPPPRCAMHGGMTCVPVVPTTTTTTLTFTPPIAPSLSDADVERIARRAAEIVVELHAARRTTP